MKTVKFTHFIHKYGTVLKGLNEGVMITKDDKPYFMLTKPEKKDVEESRKVVDAKAEKVVKEYLQVDTFTQVKVPKPQMLGKCSLCGRQGPVIRKKHLNEAGIMIGGFLCPQCLELNKAGSLLIPKYNPKYTKHDMNTNSPNSDLRTEEVDKTIPRPGNINPESNPSFLKDFGTNKRGDNGSF